MAKQLRHHLLEGMLMHGAHPNRTSRGRVPLAIGGACALVFSALAPLPAAFADEVVDLGTASDYGASTAASGLQADTSATGAWFIEAEATPVVLGGNRAAANRGTDALVAEADDLGVDLEVRHTFTTLWTGISADLSDEEAALMAEADSVQAVYPVVQFERPPAPTSSERPDMASALPMTGADIVQSELGFTGEGISVGIIDSGVDYTHPDLGGDGEGTTFPTERVPVGYDFVGDSFNADASSPTYQPVPEPDEDPQDCESHGTHVAGIVGASGDPAADGVRGVAPDVTFGAYRVFGCDGSTTGDIMLAAMERALADEMDVVNMSIGSAFSTWPQYPTAVAGDNLADSGVTVVASIGNSGASGTWSAGAPGVGNNVIGVASFDNVETSSLAFRTQPDGATYQYLRGSAAPPTPTEGGSEIAVAEEILACAPLDGDYADQVVVVQRGECDFHTKAYNVQEAGGSAVVIANNQPGLITPTVAGPNPITIPVAAISQADGTALIEAVTTGAATELQWLSEVVTVPSPTGGLISSFSSYGLTAELKVKPDLGAPGGFIWSTIPLDQGGYASKSGTSMSAPHVAGAVALLFEARGTMGHQQVKELFQNSADPQTWSLNTAVDYLEPVHRQGAGMLDIDDAILSTVHLSPGALSLGESEAGPVTETITATNDGPDDVTYAVSFEDGISTSGNPNNPAFSYATSTVQVPETVTVPAGGSASLDVTISPNTGLELAQYGGYVILTPEEGEPLRVPYAGFAGDYQALPRLGDIGAGLPVLAELTACQRLIGVDCTMGGSWLPAPDGATYSMADGDVPTMLVHRVHPLQQLQLTVYAARDGERHLAYGPTATFLDAHHLGRSGSAAGFTPYTWDGTLNSPYTSGVFNQDWPVPDGDYIIELEVLSALGDPDNPDHVERVDSAAFTIDRDGDGNPDGEFLEQLQDVPPRLKPVLRCIVLDQGRC